MPRPLRRAAIVAIGLVLFLALGLCLEELYYHPRVPLRGPRVVTRVPNDPSDVTVVLGGDFAPTDAAMRKIAELGYRYPYMGTDAIFRGADVAFANLESPVTRAAQPTWVPKRYLYKTDPAALDAWRWLGLDVVGLANNHVLDYRQVGLLDTIAALDGAELSHVGAGADLAGARRGVVLDVGGTRIGFLGYLENRVGYALGERLFAGRRSAGCAPLDTAALQEDVQALRRSADLVLVSVHWGDNYADVTAAQRDAADALVRLGVDVVIGHHAHSAQPVRISGKTTVLYSLGNYAWGAPGHGVRELTIGIVARVHVAPRPARVRFVDLLPIVTQNRIVDYQPRRLRAEEREWLDALVRASRAMGTRVDVLSDDAGPFARVSPAG